MHKHANLSHSKDIIRIETFRKFGSLSIVIGCQGNLFLHPLTENPNNFWLREVFVFMKLGTTKAALVHL